MNKATKYINLITDMYTMSEKAQEQLKNNIDLIEKGLENYIWEDIKWAIERYYTYKNDKTYPKLCHIIAILNATGKIIKKEEPIPEILPPQTYIREIKDLFPKVCKKLHIDGIFWSEYYEKIEKIPFGNKNYIDQKTKRMCNKRWVWEEAVDTMMMNFPQEILKFKKLTTVEKYTFAYKLGCFGVKNKNQNNT